MPNPKRRHSNQRTRKRRTHHRIRTAGLAYCPNCRSPKRPHHVCPVFGYYDGRPVVSVKPKETKSPRAR